MYRLAARVAGKFDTHFDDVTWNRSEATSFAIVKVRNFGIDVAQESYVISSSKQVYADGNYTIGHSSSIYLIDRAGRLRAVMPYGHGSDDFVHDLKILLRS